MSVDQPADVIAMINKAVRTSRDMRREINREPTEAELAAKLGCEAAQVRRLLDLARRPVTLRT